MSAFSVPRILRQSIRELLERSGYWARHRSVLPYGIDYQHDIRRLSAILGEPVKVFFDVGANIGQTSSAVLETYPDVTVVAFEPDNTTFSALTSKILSRQFRPFNLALSDKSGSSTFFSYGDLATSSSLVENSQYATRARHEVTTRSVDCETLDAFCGAHSVELIDVLKVDTEGHDLAVLEGGKRMLSENRVRFVYVEFNTLLPKAGTTGGALLPISELLEPVGFRFIASYPEYMITTGDVFVTSNALFLNQSA